MIEAKCERRQFNIFCKKSYFMIRKKISFEKKDTTIISALRAEIIDYYKNSYKNQYKYSYKYSYTKSYKKSYTNSYTNLHKNLHKNSYKNSYTNSYKNSYKIRALDVNRNVKGNL